MKVKPPAYLKQRMNSFGAELMGHCNVQKRIFSEFSQIYINLSLDSFLGVKLPRTTLEAACLASCQVVI